MYSGGVKRVSLEDFEPCVEVTDSLDMDDKDPKKICLSPASELIKWINANQNPLHEILGFRKEINGITVDIALQWCVDGYSAKVLGYANSIRTMDGGTHIDGAKASITRTINSLVKKSKLIEDKDIVFSEEHVMEGVACVVSVIVPKPEFEGRTQTRLGNPYVREIVDRSVEEYLTEYFELHPVVFKSIISKAFNNYNTGLVVKRARDMCIAERLSRSCTIRSIPEKPASCSSETSEVFIGSGDSSVTPNECANAKESSLHQSEDIVSVARKGSISCQNKRTRERPLSDDAVSTYPRVSTENTNDSSFAKNSKKPKSSVRQTAGASKPPKPRDVSKKTPKDVTHSPIKTRPVIPIGPGFQAEIPVWIAPTRMGKFYGSPGDSDTLRWLGTGVWPTYSLKKTVHYKRVGEGRSDSCSCASPGSTNCIKLHIKEQRELLEKEIKRGFHTMKFDEMGEEDGSKSWTPKEEQRFQALVKKNPLPSKDRFWEIAFNAFPKKSHKDLISYYYNVFLIKRMRLQLANSPPANHIDSDDDHNENFIEG